MTKYACTLVRLILTHTAFYENMIRLLIAEDHDLVRAALVSLLREEPDIDVIGSVTNGADVVGVLESGTEVDVVVTDLHMPQMSGIELAGLLSRRFAHTKALILTSEDAGHQIAAALTAGAAGYLIKGVSASELTGAIRQIHAGMGTAFLTSETLRGHQKPGAAQSA
jgi:DNA-binding NarL/FixJ family response regulator